MFDLFVEAGPPSICVCSYSTVDVIKQRNMVNLGVRDTKGMDLEGGVF